MTRVRSLLGCCNERAPSKDFAGYGRRHRRRPFHPARGTQTARFHRKSATHHAETDLLLASRDRCGGLAGGHITCAARRARRAAATAEMTRILNWISRGRGRRGPASGESRLSSSARTELPACRWDVKSGGLLLDLDGSARPRLGTCCDLRAVPISGVRRPGSGGSEPATSVCSGPLRGVCY